MLRHATSLILLAISSFLSTAMAIEEAEYETIKKENNFEIRRYSDQIVAETIVDESFDNAGSEAFKRLFDYISGNNRSFAEIAMTAPVSQRKDGKKISMTAPVTQSTTERGWAVSFMMPSSYTMETLPIPNDPRITPKLVPARTVASVEYSGTWSQENYLENRESLLKWIKEHGLTISGEPVWARYNPPFTLWFLRRNEILIPIEHIE
jgi:effector-binding domain-containing protein